MFVSPFLPPSVWEVCSRPQNFNLGICFHGDMRETKPPLFRILSKSFNLFTDPNMIEAIAQNCAQTKGPTIKMNKTNFEVHRLRTNLHLLILIYVFRKRLQCSCIFGNFQKKMKNCVLWCEKSLWQEFENQRSDMTVFLYFPCLLSWYTPFFL